MVYDDKTTSFLIRQFLCYTPIIVINEVFQENANYLIGINAQKEILQNTVNSLTVKRYPLKRSYQVAFLKWFMKKIEANGGEIHDELYTTYCDLISLSLDEPVHYRHFIVDNGTLDCITLQESTNIISEGTTGLCSWQAAVSLSKWYEENKRQLDEKTILELGSGVGLTGLNIITTCTPKEYIFSDCHHLVLKMLCNNIKLNLLPPEKKEAVDLQESNDKLKLRFEYDNCTVKVVDLKWEDIYNYISDGFPVPDVIIAADILYENGPFDALITGLKILLSFPNRYAIIAATVRNSDTISKFTDQLGNYGLSFEDCALKGTTLRIQLTDSPIRILKIFH